MSLGADEKRASRACRGPTSALTRVVELLNIVGRNAMLLQEIQALVREPHLLIHRKKQKRHGMSLTPKREATSPRRLAGGRMHVWASVYRLLRRASYLGFRARFFRLFAQVLRGRFDLRLLG